MSSKEKGKAVDTGGGGGKRKRCGKFDDDKSGGGKKKRNREVLQFFEDAADVDDYESDDSDFDFDLDVEDYMDEEYDVELKVKNEPPKFQNLPLVPKEEEMDEEEFDKMMEKRFKNNPRFRHVEDADGTAMERNSILASIKDPTVWKVKCMVGRERHSAFCLMQKFVDLKPLGTKLQIISAFAVDHIKGFVYVEADKEIDIIEACKGLSNIYSTRVAPVPKNEVSHLLSIQKSCNQVTEGMWARVKNGNYKGDLTQIVAVNNMRKRATVKLIPRIDLQALAQKFGGGVAIKKAAIPAPRLISSSELEEFRPLIQYRRDRDTGKMFEVLDGLMLKDGYLYKRVSIDSLSCWGVMPTEEELLKFRPSENNESDNLEWLTQIYGGPKKKRVIGNEKSGEKGESSLASGQNRYELYDLVCFGRKDFGLIVGMEKDDSYRILKHGPQEQQVVNLELRELKNGPSDMKFTALDRHSKLISISDTVKVLEGSLKDRQGIVKQIYRGVIFIYDHNETKDGGYFCSKAQLCEKIKLSFDACNEKGGESGSFGFEDFPSSPKSPLSPKRPWQAKENTRGFNQGEKDGMFSIGQTLRIRVGPLKGYLCQVLAIRYSDITVKLGSKQKVLTVKSEHLSEVRGKSSAMPASDDHGSNSFKPFDLLGTEGGSGDWTGGAGTAREGDGWNTGGLSTERTSWPSFSSSGITPQTESNPVNPSSSADNELKKDAPWESQATANHSSSWGATSADGWNKAVTNIGSSTGASDGWGQATLLSENLAGSSRGSGDNWGQEKVENSSIDAAAAWDEGKTVANQTSSWGNAATDKNQVDSWGISNDAVETGSWEKSKNSSTGEECWGNKNTGWNQQKSQGGGDSWGRAVEDQDKPTEGCGNAGRSRTQPEDEDADKASGWMKAKVDSASQTGAWGSGKKISEDATGWTKDGSSNQNQTDGWNKPKAFGSEGGSSWNNKGDSTWAKSEGGSSWNRRDGDQEFGGWHQESEGGSSWNNKGDSTWGKSELGSSWNRQDRDEEFGGGHQKSDSGRGSGVRGRGGGRGGRGRSFGEFQSFGWKGGENNSSGNERDQEFSGWNKTYDGGRGSGGRGRGGGRGGRGRSFGEGQSFGWKGGEKNSSDIDQGGSWGKSKGFEESRESGWRSVSSGGDGGSGWSKSWGADKGTDGSIYKRNSGDISAGGQNEGGSWNAPKSADGNSSSGWNTKADDADANQSSGWDTQLKKDSEHKDKSDGWNSGKGSDGGSAKGWGQTASWKGVANDSGGPSDTGRNQNASWGNKSNWNSGSSDAGGNANSTWGQKSNWSSGTSDAGGNANSTWGKKSNWSSGSGDAGGNADSTWGKKSNWSSGSGGAGGNADSTWGKKSNGNSESDNADGDHNSGWAKKSNWNSGSSDANQESGWGKKSSCSSGCGDGNLDSSVACDGDGETETYGNRAGGGSWRGSFGGRGGSDRGGFRGRGVIGGFGGRNNRDRGGYGGRGRSERGEFGGRGGSDRGGFGGRGRGRRDQSGGWNNNSGKDKTFDRRNGTNNSSGGWKNNDGGSSWSQGGGDTSHWSSWNSESGRTSSQSGGGQSSGWNLLKEAKEGTTSGGPTDSWGKGSASSWGNKGDEGNAKGEWGWNKGAGSSGDEAKPWNQSSSGGGQSSGWSQSTGAKEGN